MSLLSAFQLSKEIDQQTMPFRLASPGLSAEVMAAIKCKADKYSGIELALPISENDLRLGIGEFAGLKDLAEKTKMYSVEGLRIGLLASPVQSYIFFQQSLYIENDRALQAVTLKYEAASSLWNELIGLQAPIEDLFSSGRVTHDKTGLGFKVRPVGPKSLENLEKVIENNPPRKPDLKRIENVYTHKLEVVELEFEGANLGVKSMQVPAEVLSLTQGIKDRVRISLSYFDEKDKAAINGKLKHIKERVADLRKKYLVRLESNNKSVIKLENKKRFEEEVKAINEALTGKRAEIIAFLEKRKDDIMKNLRKGFEAELKKRKTPNGEIGELLYSLERRIDFESFIHDLEDLSIEVRYFNFTYDSLKDTKVLGELKERKVIEEAKFENAAENREVFGVG